ncbi:MAG: MFS transporter, partial [Lachnospiraceae bacterium]|nr:MFS transporter [Lachnospiraceae bacterium]
KFHISLSSMFAKEAVLPAIVLFFLSVCFSLINSYVYIFASGRLTDKEYTYIGIYFAIYAGTLLFTRPFVEKLADKYGTVKVTVPSVICFAASFWVLSFSQTLWMFYLAAFLSAFGYGACQPSLNALSMKMVPKERRGAGNCTNYIGIDMGQLLGPSIGGMIAGVAGYANMWRYMTVSMACALFVVLAFRRKLEPSGGK